MAKVEGSGSEVEASEGKARISRKALIAFCAFGAEITLAQSGRLSCSFPGNARNAKSVYEDINVQDAVKLVSMIADCGDARAAILAWEQLPASGAPVENADDAEDDGDDDADEDDDDADAEF